MRGCTKELHLVGVHARYGRTSLVSHVGDRTSSPALHKVACRLIFRLDFQIHEV
jgi:hypothetical protein